MCQARKATFLLAQSERTAPKSCGISVACNLFTMVYVDLICSTLLALDSSVLIESIIFAVASSDAVVSAYKCFHPSDMYSGICWYALLIFSAALHFQCFLLFY